MKIVTAAVLFCFEAAVDVLAGEDVGAKSAKPGGEELLGGVEKLWFEPQHHPSWTSLCITSILQREH